jgi:hypothetical protein
MENCLTTWASFRRYGNLKIAWKLIEKRRVLERVVSVVSMAGRAMTEIGYRIIS